MGTSPTPDEGWHLLAPDLWIQVQVADDTRIRALACGAIDAHSAAAFADALSGMAAEDRTVVLDLSGVTLLASAGVGALQDAAVQLAAMGCRFRVDNPSTATRRTLDLVKALATARTAPHTQGELPWPNDRSC